MGKLDCELNRKFEFDCQTLTNLCVKQNLEFKPTSGLTKTQKKMTQKTYLHFIPYLNTIPNFDLKPHLNLTHFSKSQI